MKEGDFHLSQDVLNPSLDVLKAKARELAEIPEDNLSLPR